MSTSRYFPQNYGSSRQSFRELAAPLGGRTGTWKIPSRKDPDLTVDYVYLAPAETPRRLFVITSGIHGSECYLGAAIQQMLMRELLPLVDRRHNGILIVHAMNPYGFKYHERCTENAVNLNRNFSVSGEMYKLKNEASYTMNERFLPKKPVDSRRSYLLSTLELRTGGAFFDGISLDEFTKSVSPGQFAHVHHVEYGGRKLEPQSAEFVALMRELMPAYRDIIGLDLHTGLGERGRLHLLAGGGEERVDESLFHEVFDPERDHAYYEYTPPEAEGFYEVYGGINAAFVELAKPEQRVCAVTMEYGTLGHSLEKQIEGLNSFFLDHQGRFYGYATPELEGAIQRENFERSYPDSKAWKSQVMDASHETLKRIFARMK